MPKPTPPRLHDGVQFVAKLEQAIERSDAAFLEANAGRMEALISKFHDQIGELVCLQQRAKSVCSGGTPTPDNPLSMREAEEIIKHRLWAKAHHEAGHGVVADLLSGAHEPQLVTIGRYRAGLGHCLHPSLEGIPHIVCSFAGEVAESRHLGTEVPNRGDRAKGREEAQPICKPDRVEECLKRCQELAERIISEQWESVAHSAKLLYERTTVLGEDFRAAASCGVGYEEGEDRYRRECCSIHTELCR